MTYTTERTTTTRIWLDTNNENDEKNNHEKNEKDEQKFRT